MTKKGAGFPSTRDPHRKKSATRGFFLDKINGLEKSGFPENSHRKKSPSQIKSYKHLTFYNAFSCEVAYLMRENSIKKISIKS